MKDAFLSILLYTKKLPIVVVICIVWVRALLFTPLTHCFNVTPDKCGAITTTLFGVTFPYQNILTNFDNTIKFTAVLLFLDWLFEWFNERANKPREEIKQNEPKQERI